MSYQRFRLNSIWVLIGLNFLLFIVTFIAPDLIYSFLGLSPATFLHQPWTIVTNLFVHAPPPFIWHIMGNMITLYFFGSFLYRLVGKGRFLALYFGGGILGNILYIFLAYTLGIDFFTPVVGASGAIFALGGALAVMRPRLRVFVFPIPAPIPLWIAVIGGFLILSFLPFIAWQAHLGGLVFGLVMGYFFRKRERYFF
jgi:membrane associated rhomboid family serine protease